jgi:hypothetical protein
LFPYFQNLENNWRLFVRIKLASTKKSPNVLTKPSGEKSSMEMVEKMPIYLPTYLADAITDDVKQTASTFGPNTFCFGFKI